MGNGERERKRERRKKIARRNPVILVARVPRKPLFGSRWVSFSTILNEVWPKRLPSVPAPRFVEIRRQVSNKGHLICILFVCKMERSILFFFFFGTTREARDTSSRNINAWYARRLVGLTNYRKDHRFATVNLSNALTWKPRRKIRIYLETRLKFTSIITNSFAFNIYSV